MISNPKNNDGWIQISQIAAFTYNNEDGSSTNVASIINNPQATVTNKKPGNPTWPWPGKWPTLAIKYSIDGVLKARPWDEGFYHSPTPGPFEIWQLDLSKEYPLFNVVFFSRSDSAASRTAGSTLILENASRTRMLKIKMDGSNKQEWDINDNNAVDYSPPIAILADTGTSQTFASSVAYANRRGGRLGTGEELQYFIMRQPSGELIKGDHWVAVTNGYNNGNDYIQIGNPGYGAGWTPLCSHVLMHRGFPGWGITLSNQAYNRHVFYIEPVTK